MTKPLRMATFVLALAAMAPAAAHAERYEDKATFNVVIRGISAATLSFSGVQNGRQYAVAGVLKSSGIAALVRKVSYSAKAKGTVSNGRYTPSSYVEDSDNGKRKSQSRMTYRGGVPSAVTYTPPRPDRKSDVNPASQGGTVDTLTALYAILRDVEPGQECKVNLKMYDGRYTSSIALTAPQRSGDMVTCSGEYRRLQGFSAEEMAERTRFPFTLTYQPAANGRMQVTEVVMESVYGKAAMKRR